ncbi:MAG: MFS transporter [Acidimicrobiales bacterium]
MSGEAATASPPTPARHGRLPAVIVAFLMFLTTMGSNAPSPLYVIYQHKFHFSALIVTAVFATYAGTVMLALFTVGHLSDLIGRKKMLVPALFLLGISALLFAAARGTGWLFAARAVQGLATGTITGAATAALVELDPAGDRHRASYINTVMFITGAAVGPLLFGIAAQYFPAPLVFPFAIEGGLIVVGLFGVKALPETVSRTDGPVWQMQRPSVPRPVLGPFIVAVLALGVAWGIGGLYGALSASIDRSLLHVHSHAVAGVVLFVFAGIGGVSQLSLRRWPALRSIVVGTVATAVGMGLVYAGLVATNVAIFMAGTLLAGAGSGVSFMGSLVLVNHVAPPARRAEVVSAWNLIGYIALSAPAVGVGLLTGVTGLRNATGVFTAAIIGLSAVTVVAALMTPRQPLAKLSEDELMALGMDPAVIASGTG